MRWSSGPLRPQLERAVIDVWRVDLSAFDDRQVSLLDEQERKRAAAVLGERDRRLWSASRGALRTLLGRYLQLDPGTLRFRNSAHGKPALRAVADCPAPCFNLSHSRELALYAFSERDEVGVDVELVREGSDGRPPRDHVALARRAFGEDAAQYLQRVPPHEHEREFLRRWTRYEAALKQLDVGIGDRRTPIDRHASWIAELDIGTDGAAAVACAWPARELRLWDLVE
jgi:4'-phosphopantetheinyl transferase